jgi:hypothetical protein
VEVTKAGKCPFIANNGGGGGGGGGGVLHCKKGPEEVVPLTMPLTELSWRHAGHLSQSGNDKTTYIEGVKYLYKNHDLPNFEVTS